MHSLSLLHSLLSSLPLYFTGCCCSSSMTRIEGREKDRERLCDALACDVCATCADAHAPFLSLTLLYFSIYRLFLSLSLSCARADTHTHACLRATLCADVTRRERAHLRFPCHTVSLSCLFFQGSESGRGRRAGGRREGEREKELLLQ